VQALKLQPWMLGISLTEGWRGEICHAAINRKFVNDHHIDLYVPGNPVHPLTFINGVMDMLGIKK
jgi:hypothetical protein